MSHNPMYDAVFNLKYRGDGDYDENDLFQGSNEKNITLSIEIDM